MIETSDFPPRIQPGSYGDRLSELGSPEFLRALSALLLEHGSVLLRGFPDSSVVHFRALVTATSSGPMAYVERSSPRRELGDGVYTSTEYPAHQSIFPHNEHSYSIEFPHKLYFYCETPASAGGQTPLVRTRRVTRALDPAISQKFRTLGWRYVRSLRPHVGVPWQDVFQCKQRSQAEDYCRSAHISLEWLGDDSVRLVQRRPAFEVHPTSRELLWFNHIVFFHSSTLPPDVRDALRGEFGPHGMPNETYYGDGSVIDDETIASLRRAYQENTETFEWQAGDILLLDNMLCAHGRESFIGPRRVLVAMADPVRREQAAWGSS